MLHKLRLSYISLARSHEKVSKLRQFAKSVRLQHLWNRMTVWGCNTFVGAVWAECGQNWVTIKGTLHGDVGLFLCASLQIYQTQNLANGGSSFRVFPSFFFGGGLEMF